MHKPRILPIVFMTVTYIMGYMTLDALMKANNMNYGAAIHSAQGLLAIAQHDYKSAIIEADRSLASSDNYFGHTIKAISYTTEGETKNSAMAEESISKALNHKPENLKLHLMRGLARLDIGDFNGALEDMDLYLSHQESSHVYFSRGVSKMGIYKTNKNEAYLISAIYDFERARVMFHRENATDQEAMVNDILQKINNHEKKT